MPTETITISNKIDTKDPRIQHAINRINSAPDGTTLIIRFDHNCGGAVQEAMDLIEAIENCNSVITIILTFKGYAVSASAFILGYFAFYNVVSTHVVIQMDGPVCLVYHKPRLNINNIDYFSSVLYPDRTYQQPLEYLRRITLIFDTVFSSIITSCYTKKIRIAPHMTSVYNMNGDVCVMFKDGKI